MSTASQDSHIAQQLINNIKGLPLWVKQVVYLELREELMGHFVPESLNTLTSDDTVAFYVPKITEEGERLLLDRKDEIGMLLMDSKNQYTVLDVCLRHEWSLEICCHFILEAISQQWLKPPGSTKAMGTIEYLGNRIRLGEYLVKMGRISLDQLEQALRTQQYIKEALQEHTGLANILINLGYITRQDTEGILFLKEESRKPFEGIALFEKLL
jgi:hypothetical protein